MSTPPRPRPVVVAVEGGERYAAVEWAAQEAIRRSAPLTLLHAYSPEMSVPWGDDYAVPTGDLQQLAEQARSNAAGVLDEAAGHLRDQHSNLQVSTTAATASPAASLVLASKGCSVLALGKRTSHHWPGSLGSVSSAVVAHAACPVVVVPAAAEQDCTLQVVLGVENWPFFPRRYSSTGTTSTSASRESWIRRSHPGRLRTCRSR